MGSVGDLRPARAGLSFDWAFWFQWIVATTMGWLLGRFILPGTVPLALGLGIGALQWPALSRRMSGAWRWIVASAVGGVAGWAMAFALLPPELDLLGGFFLGTTLGLTQWLILRREVKWAGWWIPLSAVAWTVGLGVVPGLFSSGAVPGAITGAGLELLLRTRRSERAAPPGSQRSHG